MQITNKRYNDYSSFIKARFNERVQKISINTGFSCPNRDGTKGVGGCTYCNNNSFNPDYCAPSKSITQQLDEGISFFAEKYKSQQYLAYFQAYTNTYAEISLVKQLYTEAINHPKVIGLVIGTRPDCISEELISFLSGLAEHYFISLDFGIESTLNKTLELVNRCHTYEETIAAYELSKDRGLHLGGHLILGLP
ncbi:MAG: TIGR01212 family radical SAM protein, partial [Cyclobacteriaceae bacterium]|nr:TIGR01212 family radical SAM protein [Cyclobacteriaceae bacterium]